MPESQMTERVAKAGEDYTLHNNQPNIMKNLNNASAAMFPAASKSDMESGEFISPNHRNFTNPHLKVNMSGRNSNMES